MKLFSRANLEGAGIELWVLSSDKGPGKEGSVGLAPRPRKALGVGAEGGA